MPLTEGQFLELEKRLISFKAQFGVTNTGKGTISQEKFGKSYNIFPEDILLEGDKILFNKDNSVLEPELVRPSRIRTWVTSSDPTITDIHEKINRGHFETTETGFTENPFIEQIICPLTRVQGTKGQFYIAFGMESQSLGTYEDGYNTGLNINSGKLFSEIRADYSSINQSAILTNFINPAKFGSAYQVKIFGSDTRIEDNGLTYPINLPNDGSSTTPNLGSFPNFFDPNTIGVTFTNDAINANYYQPWFNEFNPEGITPGEFAPDGEPGVYEGWVFDSKGGTLLVGVAGGVEGGTEGAFPFEDASITDTWAHPLWLIAYRYIGPTGFSHPEANLTASNVQINDNLNVDGAITLQGLNFVSIENSELTGSVEFGNNISSSIHKFTGSVFITGGLFVDGESTAGGGGGQSGINPFVFSSPNLNYSHSKEYGYYNKTTIEPTDENDIIEFTSSFGLKVSGSIQTNKFVALLGTNAINHISKSIRKGTDFEDNVLASTPIPESNVYLQGTIYGSGSSGGYLFNYYSTEEGEDYPVLTSYTPFLVKNSGSSHHKFHFPKPVNIGKIGLHHSNNDINFTAVDDEFPPGIDTVELLGSNDGITYTQLYITGGIKEASASGGSIGYFDPGETYEVNGPDEIDEFFPETSYAPEANGNSYNNLESPTEKLIKFHTSSIINNTEKYKFFELRVSGGIPYPIDTSFYYHYLHNISIWENKNPGTGNRKHLTIGFDDTQDPNKPEGTTLFDSAVSSSVATLGITSILEIPADFDINTLTTNTLTTDTATINSTLTSNNITNTDTINTNILNAVDKINIDFNGNTITFENDGFSEFNKSIYLANTPNLSDGFASTQKSIVLDSLNPIYFTNRKGDGTVGTDTFSGRIFGHYNADGASDLYIDAHRIYNVSDKEIRLIALDQSEGVINLSASAVNIEHDLVVAGNIDFATITQNGFPFSGGEGSGFPHNQATTQVTSSITGALEIGSGTATGDTAVTNPHIILNPVIDEDIFNNNKTTDHILHNYGNALYWGNAVISTGDVEDNTFTNVTLAGNPLDLGGVGINGTGNIDITGDVIATGTGSFGHLNATINVQPSHSIDNVVSLVYDKTTNQIHYTGSYGAGGTGGEDDDWIVSDLVTAIDTPYVLSSRNVKVTGSVDISTTYKIDDNNVLSIGTGDNKETLKLASPYFSSLQVEFQQPVFSISESGNVGIFNITPTERLVVEGSISASGKIFAKNLTEFPQDKIVTYDTKDGRFYITSSTAFSGDSNTVTNIYEETTLDVSPINVPFLGIDKVTVQQDTGNISTSTGEFTTHVTPTSASLVDGYENGIGYFKIYDIPSPGVTKGTNIIFNFKTPVIVSEFRQNFLDETNDELVAGSRHLPKEVKIYGKNSPFVGGEEEGTLLAQGARVYFTPISDQDPNGDGTVIPIPMAVKSQQRTSSIAETSLTSSFQYYRIRYSGSFENLKGDPASIIINEITPVTRSFTRGTTISFNNGVIECPQIITNNLIGTASYALYSEISDYATNGFPFSGSAVISGSLSVSGNVDFQNLSLNGNLDMNGYSMENINHLDAISANIGYLESNTINTTTLNVNTINANEPVNITGSIAVTSIIAGDTVEDYDGFEILSVQKRKGHPPTYGLVNNNNSLVLKPSHFAFTSGSSSSLTDNNGNTSIIVNQNTLGDYTTASPLGPYPLYPVSTNTMAINVIQTSSFFVKYKFPEPVLIDHFKIDFSKKGGEIIGYEYSENSMSLDGNRVFDNDDGNDNITKYLGNINTSEFFSSDLRILVDDPGSDYQFEPGSTDNLSPTIPYHKAVSYVMDTSNPLNNDIIIGYDFGAGNEEIISKYTLYLFKNHNTSLFLFEGSNDGTNYTTLDIAGQDPNDVLGNYVTTDILDIYDASPGGTVNAIHTRDQNDFQNTTAFRYYRFKFLEYDQQFEFTIFKFDFYQATEITEGTETQYNPEYISIYSNQEGEGPNYDQETDTIYSPFSHYPGTFKGTTTINSSDTNKTASIEAFNSANGNPISKYFTIEFSGSHNPSNLVSVAEITPVTRSYTTQSLEIGPGLCFPNLPSQSVDCSQANAVYWDETTGCLFYTSSCGGTTVIDGDIIADGDVIADGTITGDGGHFGDVQIVNNEIRPKPDKELKIKVDKIVPSDGKKLSLGDRNAPIDEMHIKQSTIHFYSSSDAYSSSLEVARMTINSSSNEVEFKSGSDFINVKAKELKLGESTQTSFTKTDLDNLKDGKSITSATINQDIAYTQYIKPEAVISDTDNSTYTKFTTPGRIGQFVSGTLLFDQNLSGSNNYIKMGTTDTQIDITGNVTASGEIFSTSVRVRKSGSALGNQEITLTPELGIVSVQNDNGSTLFKAETKALAALGKDYVAGGIIQKGSGSFTLLLDADATNQNESKFSIRSNSSIPGAGGLMLTVSESGETRMYDHLKVDSHITASGNISGSYITTASFGSLQLNNLPTSPVGLPTGSVWVSGSQNDSSTSNVNCGTLRIVI